MRKRPKIVGYLAIITDSWAECPGKICLGPFATRKEANWAIQNEISAASALFTDGRAVCSGRVEIVTG